MINKFIYNKIFELFPFEPTDEQAGALRVLADFIVSPQKDAVLLFKGYAGTGKTTMLGATVKALDALKYKTFLLAPTGRAAKVFSQYAGHQACTIHKKIYRKKSFSAAFDGFLLSENLHKDTLFIVDEASMISNEPAGANVFGSGRLLDDLMHYVYSGENCKLILLGDTAQLPPVSTGESPALNVRCLEKYCLHAVEIELTHVVRQAQDSGILINATNIRNALRCGKIGRYPNILAENFPDVKRIRGDELIEEISSSYSRTGVDDTMVICRSNKNANIYNRGIRNSILYREDEISQGDRLMVVKNNYFRMNTETENDFIANGEIIRVLRVRKYEEMYGFRFCNVLVSFEDYDTEMELKIILDALSGESPALTAAQNYSLFAAVNANFDHIKNKRERMKMIKNDPYFNALQVKYAYAITCHKAQGGQWSHVFLDVGYVTEGMMGEDFYRWLYTAFTRATRKLFLVNWRMEERENG
jgi:exodeoxyribonuclease-5